MLNREVAEPPVYKIDEDRTVTNADGSSTTPANAVFFPNRYTAEYGVTKDVMRQTYGNVQVFEFDGNGRRMGLLLAPGLDVRKELNEIMQVYRSQGNDSMVKSIMEGLTRLRPAPSLQP